MVLYYDSNNKCCVVEMHQWWKLWLLHVIIEWKSIHYFVYRLEIPLSTNEGNLAHV